ncbi:methyltransferase [Niabella ginsenosidivorans]|uniref:Methyltransferase n=1 Tax=Niabella ginsenosidivorans TaxID=1176587 RepID=A0A1A9HX12_9BACT|nr:class I SAM-dependent methyltransferase [Niabella ginsenosidivorans]ANH79916.1 methyltransferase [Niabella ginsenosidivorans]
MQDNIFPDIPVQYNNILSATRSLDFNMASDLQTGSLLKTLVASKPGSNILELGTGSGLSASWILEGMDKSSRLTSIENNAVLLNIAKEYLNDDRVSFVLADGYEWISSYTGPGFDFIFADAMPGKYDLFEETIAQLNEGGFYVIDDMLPQPNWPEGHAAKAAAFITMIGKRKDLAITKLNWSTGIIIATKHSMNP